MDDKTLKYYLDYYSDYLHHLSPIQKYILEKLIKFVHVFMIFVVVIGPFITKNITYLSLIIIYNIAVVTLWYVFGHCCCNTIENKLNTVSDNESFIVGFIKKILNDPNGKITEHITTFIPFISATICLYKIKKICKKCK
jgi:ABC-type bacteriocin/lantibiotic exporter with double-glycine peptidase domain